MKRYHKIIIVSLTLLLLTACVPSTINVVGKEPAGFFSGLWHGWIAPFSLVFSFFKPELSIYESYNVGVMYDLGFYIAIISGFGSIAFKRRKK